MKTEDKAVSSILFIVGPTASGKSGLAMELARAIDGEIICADSQTIRRGLDVGTAKPSIKDRIEIPHHLVDIIDPYDSFSVNRFKVLALKAIDDIIVRGRVPIIVGGTGLYIDALFFDFDIDLVAKKDTYKEHLEELSVESLQRIITENHYIMPTNKDNPRHLIGVILRGGALHKNTEPIVGAYMFGLMPDDSELKNRINQRVEAMFNEGLIDEVKSVIEKYGRPTNKMDAIGYPIVMKFLDGELTLEEAKILFAQGHWQYARRQKSWFKRNPHIRWLNNVDSATLDIIKEVKFS